MRELKISFGANVLLYLYAIVKQYPLKIIVAWGEAISGNTKIRDWLKNNNYAELAAFVSAIHLQDDARVWLMKHGFAELMALVMGSEGDAKAIKWLNENNYSNLALIAKGADNDDEAVKKLLLNGEKEWGMISLKIRAVKNQIQEENDDWHKQSRR